MNPDNGPLLLSLRPGSASAVLAGEKTVEVRRTPTRAGAGTPVVLYATAPVSAAVGTVRLAEVQTLPPGTAWERHGAALGLSRAAFFEYLTGVEAAHLLLFREAVTLGRRITLDDLRRDHPFRPPRSFRHLRADDPAALTALVSGLAPGATSGPPAAVGTGGVRA